MRTRSKSKNQVSELPAIADQVRQGDILVHPVAGRARGRVRAPEQGRVVLAHGEVTGHSHDVSESTVATQFEDTEFAGTTVLDVTAPTIVVHQEHSPVPLAARQYEVRRAEEWTDSDEPRQVAD